MQESKTEINLKLQVYEGNWTRFKERIPDYINHLEKYINDTGAAIASQEETENIAGVQISFFSDEELKDLF